MIRRVIVDANRLFSALIAGSHRIRQILISPPHVQFVAPKYVFVELFKHKERIAAASALSEDELLALLHTLLERVHFFDEDAIRIGCWAEAWRLCRDVDEKDVAYVALTLELEGFLWTGDRELESGLRRKGFDRFFEPPAMETP
jgi:predicted nucleic acid-binding protein